MTKASELRDLGVADLRQRLHELDDQLFRLKMQKAMGQLDALSKFQSLRRDVARVKTVLREKELAAS